MAIHHATVKAAEKLGFTLEEQDGTEMVRAYAPKFGQQVFGVSAKDAFNQMSAMLKIIDRNPDLRLRHMEGDLLTHGRLVDINKETNTADSRTPVAFYRDFNDLVFVPFGDEDDNFETQQEQEPGYRDIADTFDHKDEIEDKAPLIARSEGGVALDGAVAYAEGVMAADNPFPEGSEEGDLWDSQWDQAADDAPEQDNSEKGGSVVASKYRTKYAEQGHPNHCGDWLAELLNNFCVGDKHTDLITFERICSLNGIDTSKYKREGTGWQGRIRMTGRNLLARKVFSVGKIVVPNVEVEGGTQEVAAPSDWISAQRYSKPKSE